MKSFFKTIFYLPFVLAAIAVLAQAGFFYAHVRFYIIMPYIGAAMSLFAWIIRFVFCAAVINREDGAEYKLAWCALIFVFPLFFTVLYFLSGRKKRKRHADICINHSAPNDLSASLNAYERNLSDYILAAGGGRVHRAEGYEYYNSGEKFFDAVCGALEKAEKYVFIEFYSLERGFLLSKIINLLRKKTAEGVEVKILFDGYGCEGKISRQIIKTIRSYGIEIKAFNALPSSLAPGIRTHRKIVCIDGSTAFTGGVNLGDQYIDRIRPYGRWRDTGIRTGDGAAWDFAQMFLNLWHGGRKDADILSYAPNSGSRVSDDIIEGFIQPFPDSPHYKSRVSKNVFLSLIRGAVDYVYISTPYLLLDNELLSAIIFKAESGVDVRILVPHIPDKKVIFSMTRSFYSCLIRAGVKIYEYLPGFNHAKTIISDGRIAYTGSCNLDRRALYFQHECGAMLYGENIVKPLSDDFIKTLDSCGIITKEKAEGTLFLRFFRSLLRFFSPLF